MPNKETGIHVWITKHALTSGIKEADAIVFVDGTTGKTTKMISFVNEFGFSEHYHKPDWHTSYQEAKDQAYDMLARKIRSVRKQLAKLESMKFE